MGVLAGFLKNEIRESLPATVATTAPRQPDKSQESQEEASAVVQGLFDSFAVEAQRRRDWWRRPPDGWPHSITMRSLLSGEVNVLRLREARIRQ